MEVLQYDITSTLAKIHFEDFFKISQLRRVCVISLFFRNILFICVVRVELYKGGATASRTHPADADSPELVVLGVDDVRAAQPLVPRLLPLGH